MFIPKKSKYKKVFKGRIKGNTKGGRVSKQKCKTFFKSRNAFFLFKTGRTRKRLT